MKKVCHMTSVHDPEDVRIFQKECTSLAKAGYDVTLVTRGDSYEKNGVHIVGVGQPSGGRLNRMTAFAKKVYRAAFAVDADIYHFHDPELLPYGLKLKKKGKKVIFDSHEFYSAQMQNKPYFSKAVSKMVGWAYSSYEKYVVRRLDALIFPCTINGDVPYKDVAKHISLIGNVASLHDLYDCYEESKYVTGSPMCYVGNLSSARCAKEIILAALKSGLSLVIAGEFTNSDYQEQCVQLLEGHDSIRWIGPIDHSKVAGLLQNSSIGLCPEKNVSQYHAVDILSTKTYEYMAMGLPVILAEYPYSKEVMQEYEFGVFADPDDADDIARAMKFLVEHPEEAIRMGKNGRRAIKEKFNWGEEEEKLFALYEDILES